VGIDMFHFLILLLLCIWVNEATTELLSKSMFFGFLRSFLNNSTYRVLQFFSKAIECPYCCSMWTSLFLTIVVFLLVKPILSGVVILDSFLFLIICHRFSNYLHDISDRYFSKDYVLRRSGDE